MYNNLPALVDRQLFELAGSNLYSSVGLAGSRRLGRSGSWKGIDNNWNNRKSESDIGKSGRCMNMSEYIEGSLLDMDVVVVLA